MGKPCVVSEVRCHLYEYNIQVTCGGRENTAKVNILLEVHTNDACVCCIVAFGVRTDD